MPLFPSLNDLKGMTISINPLNLFDPKPAPPSTDSPSSPVSPTTPRVGEAGPGPSSLSNRTLNAVANGGSHLNGSTTPSPLGNGAQRPRGPVKQTSSDGSSSGGDARGRPGLQGRRASSQVMIRADGPRRREKKKKVPMDSYVIVKPPPTSSKNPLNLQIQLVFKAPPGRRDRADSTATRSPSMFSTASGLGSPGPSVPPTPSAPIDGLPSVSLNSSVEMARERSDSPQPLGQGEDGDDISVLSGSAQPSSTAVRRRGSRKSSTSTVATTATAATGSTMASAKRIQPMFNLSVHNVMHPTVVTDAGTDVKVAKFLKRHIDISDVGILEPAEVWLPTSNLTAAASRDMSRPQSVYSIAGQPPYGHPISPVSTRIEARRNSVDNGARREMVVLPADGGAKKFFGKIGSTFKKRDKEKAIVEGSPVMMPVGMGIPVSPKVTAIDEVASGRVSAHPTFGCAPAIIARRHSNPLISPDGAITGLADDRCKLNIGLNSSAASIGIPQLQLQPSNRPVGYTWTVKRWAKSSTEGWAAHLVAAAAHGLELMNSLHSAGDDEVVFEWVKTRGPVPGVKGQGHGAGARVGRERAVTMAVPRSGTMMSGLAPTHSAPPSEPGDSPPERSGMSGMLRPQSSSRPPSRPTSSRRASAVSLSPHKGATAHANGSNSAQASPRLGPTSTLSPYAGSIPDDASATYHTADEDSDPEDSETPWTCSVWVKRTEQRIFLATLTPAPHHPKVVGQLKIPMKLDSVSLADLQVCGGSGTGHSGKGSASAAGRGSGPDKERAREEIKSRVLQEVCISEESLKDVVCVTALWLVAREGWGGLSSGKRRRA